MHAKRSRVTNEGTNTVSPVDVIQENMAAVITQAMHPVFVCCKRNLDIISCSVDWDK